MFRGVLSCNNTKIRSETVANKPEKAVCLFPEAAERPAFGLQAVVQRHVLVSEQERTPLNILLLSRL